MPNTGTSAVAPTLPRREIALWVAVTALLALAVSPVLTRSHVEGFTYFTETLSILLPDLSRADPLWSLTRDFFYMSRPGVIWAMAPLSDLSPGNAYDLLMWLAMPVFLSGVILAGRLAGGASWLASVAALLLLPIAVEANFFTNDNLIAGGLSLWTMAVILGRRGMAFAVLAGSLYSLAVLCRLDQVLLAPFFAVLAILPAPSLRWAVARWAAMAVGFGIVHGLFALLDPQAANLLFRIAVVTEADGMWSRDTVTLALMILRDAAAALMAFGLGLPAIIAGAVVLYARARSAARHASGSVDGLRIWAMPLLLIGYPFVIYGLTVGKYYDPRGFITMLPMLAPLAAIGLDRWVIGPLRRAPRAAPAAGRSTWTALMAALLLLPVFVPGVPILPAVLPLPAETENAPPTMTGRIWYGGAWRDWQEREFHQHDRAAERLVETLIAQQAEAAVVAAGWNEDRRLQNVLAAQGFEPLEETGTACAPVAELWSHPDGARVHLVRMHIPFLRNWVLTSASLYVAHGADCLRSVPDDRRFALDPIGVLVTRNDDAERLSADADGHFRMTDDDLERFAERAGNTIRSYGAESDPVAATAQAVVRRARERLN
ncbi:MAG: hypothetical protein HLUCCO18_12920 [Rhodobacteraceae bacterium HLUCCO18]|nr:MAG: hypothetical protein HLUCCO18_12920 [Rhodobacteraceae bacterium HLUCCO18]